MDKHRSDPKLKAIRGGGAKWVNGTRVVLSAYQKNKLGKNLLTEIDNFYKK